MCHSRVWALCCFAWLSTSAAWSQQWAEKMFEKLDHDFGTVARGSDTVHRFALKNIYKEDVHISGVRSSCGCTDPSIENELLKTYETGYIVAKFNTRTFEGIHSATLTVTFDKPYPAQVQLRVHGNIRRDVVFDPGSVDFAQVDQGSTPTQAVKVAYAGRPDWRITDVVTASESSDNYEVELRETLRQASRVNYELLVRLKPTARAGFLSDQLILVTNDARNPRIPLDVQARISPAVSVTPENWVLKVPQGAEPAIKRLIVRGRKPFKITAIECEHDASDAFSFTTDEESKAMHVVAVQFDPTIPPGQLQAPIKVVTDLGDSYTATSIAYVTVTPPEASSGSSTEPAADASDDSQTADADGPGRSNASGDEVAQQDP